MPPLRVETRTDGSLVLTAAGGGRWGTAAAGIGAGVLVLAGVAAGETTPLGSAVAIPFALIALLAGIAAARHRDWVVFDRRARQVVSRRGLASMFRPASAVPFDAVLAIRVDEDDGAFLVGLSMADGAAWPIDASADGAYVRGLVGALRAVGGWPVQSDAVRLELR